MKFDLASIKGVKSHDSTGKGSNTFSPGHGSIIFWHWQLVQSGQFALMNKLCLWNTYAPAVAIFSKTVTLIFDPDHDRWPWLWYLRNGLTPKNIYVKYESCITYHSKAMANVKIFGQTNGQMGIKLYAPNLLMQRHKQKGHDGPESLAWVSFPTKWILTFLLLLFQFMTPGMGPVLTPGLSYE